MRLTCVVFLRRRVTLLLLQGYLVSPFLAYNFSELIESHAVDTYTEFAEVNKELLQSLPPTPQVRHRAPARARGGNGERPPAWVTRLSPPAINPVAQDRRPCS